MGVNMTMDRLAVRVAAAALLTGCGAVRSDGSAPDSGEVGGADAPTLDVPADASAKDADSGEHDAAVMVGLRTEVEVTWTKGQPPIALGPEANRLCFLNRATGNFSGSGEVRVFVSNGSWYVAGTPSAGAAASDPGAVARWEQPRISCVG
jgi:hypothetical protein